MGEPRFKVGVAKAAAIAGVSRWTIRRKCNDGKLSCDRDNRGQRRIDLAELTRLYELDPNDVARMLQEQRTMRRVQMHPAPPAAPDAVVAELRARIAALEDDKAELRRDVAAAREEVKRLLGVLEKQTLMLTHQRHQEDQTPATSTNGDRPPRRPRSPRQRPAAPAQAPTLASTLAAWLTRP